MMLDCSFSRRGHKRLGYNDKGRHLEGSRRPEKQNGDHTAATGVSVNVLRLALANLSDRA